MQMTTLMYRMSVAKFLVDLCQSFVNIIFSALALHDAYNGNYLYLPDEQLEESDTVRAVSGFTYLMAALIAPVVSAYLLWMKWSYKTKLYAEQKGGLLGLPVCQKSHVVTDNRDGSGFMSFPVGRVVEIPPQQSAQKPSASIGPGEAGAPAPSTRQAPFKPSI
mmetsp:Transcript_35946/g.101802  ORF Transcript_35946/g.101802 Transcript_35946/m.101802 type:complete len:163 (-) Transcript_35946:412-900(-)